jgi:hypothetical protein
MVKSGTQRIINYNNTCDAMLLYKTLKAINRGKKNQAALMLDVHAAKDLAFLAIIAKYTLDIRRMILACEAYKKLYYQSFKRMQGTSYGNAVGNVVK